MFRPRQIVPLVIAVAVFFLLSDASGQRKAKQKPVKKKQITLEELLDTTKLTVVECKLPLIDSADDRPTFSLDGRMMVFGSHRPPMPGETWRRSLVGEDPFHKWDGDIYYRILTDTGWSIPINPGPPINDGTTQMNPTITPRGDLVYYISGSNTVIANGNFARVMGITQSRFANNTFEQPKAVGGQIQGVYANKFNAMAQYRQWVDQKILIELRKDSELFARAPDALEVHRKDEWVKLIKDNSGAKFYSRTTRCENTVTPDGRYVIFAEHFGKAGHYGLAGEGDDDLWITKISANGNWDSVLAPRGKINSQYAETYPYMAADGQTLYFSSDRPCMECSPMASGGDDIYFSRITDTGFSKPQLLPSPINTRFAEYGFSISPDGRTAYFVSNRSGKSKFYQVRLHAGDSAFAPLPVTVVYGKVVDRITKKPLHAQIYIDELSENKNTTSVMSDSVTGIYALAMQRGKRIGIQAVSKGYLPRSERLTFPKKGPFDQSNLDIELSPVEVGSMSEFRNVYFSSGKSELAPESHLELDRVVDFLKQNRNSSIEVHGHTDDVGSVEYNKQLSLDRATSVMRYLESKGIPERRMKALGFGKTKPIAKGSSEDARAKNRRVEMLVTGNAQ
jgi:outer membrane protein OmpA-like peptidoglycan-associated protein